MPSPFPGMNPYLEQHLEWHDFHERAIPLMADILAAQLDPVYASRWEERPSAGLWPLKLRDGLPTIPIPLTAPTPDARLDLQEVIHRVYDAVAEILA